MFQASELLRLLIALSVGGFIGWITNLIAIKSLFHPHNPVDFKVFKFQGLLPKRQKELSENLGRIIEGELISLQEMARCVQPEDLDPVVQDCIKKLRNDSEAKIRPYLQTIRAEFLLAPLMQELETRLFNTVKPLIPDILERSAKEIAGKISISDIVAEKIRTMDLEKIEEITYRISDKEMQMIVRLGGFLGVIVGFLQWLIIYLVG